MKKNKTIIFLIAVFLLLVVVFVIMLGGGQKSRTPEQVKKEVLQMCAEENYEDAFNFLNEILVDDPNFAKGKPGREELEKMLDRLYKVK
jgi:flagellar basal body-associated protein FliL